MPIDSIRQFEGWSEVILIQTMEGTALAVTCRAPARDAAARAPQNRGCLLGVPQSDAGVGVYTLEIAAPTRDNLIDALRADAGYTESSIDGAPSFAIATEDGLGGTTVSYTFVGDAWLILSGQSYRSGDRRTGRGPGDRRAARVQSWPGPSLIPAGVPRWRRRCRFGVRGVNRRTCRQNSRASARRTPAAAARPVCPHRPRPDGVASRPPPRRHRRVDAAAAAEALTGAASHFR
ncbi:hypothetical protein [Microbacterium aurum]